MISRTANPLTIVHLAGDEPSMGAQHGEIARALGGYEPALDFYPGLPERILHGGHRGRGRAFAVQVMKPLIHAGLARLERARPMALRRRTESFLAALGRPASDARYVFIVDMLQNAVALLTRSGIAPDVRVEARRAARRLPGACSSFAAWGASTDDGRIIHGRNFDLPGIGVWEKFPEVVFCTPDEGLRYGFVATRGADVPGVTAFNEAGLVVTAHTRFHRDVRFEARGVVDLGHLLVKRAKTLAEAIAIATETPIASSWGLLVSSAREKSAVVIETHGGRVAVVPPAASWLTCANTFRTPVMQAGELAPSAAWVRYSEGRQAVMERVLGRGDVITPRSARALLGCREAGDAPGWSRATGDTLCQSITIQSVVVDPERNTIAIGAGDAPASLGPWIEVPWSWEDRPGYELANSSKSEGLSDDIFPGFSAFMRAAELESRRGSVGQIAADLADALSAAPADPSYRHLAGGLALRSGRAAEAYRHFEAALESERSTFRRGELHLWAARAADGIGRSNVALAHRKALAQSTDPQLGAARRAAARELDGTKLAAFADVAVDFQLLTLSL